MTTPQFLPPRQQDDPAAMWVDPTEPERGWRTPPANDSTPAVRRFLVGALVIVLVAVLLWSTGALDRRDDTQTLLPAGAPMTIGAFEVKFTEAVAERQYDDTWKVKVFGTVHGLDSETRYAPSGVLAWPDGSLVHDGTATVGDGYSGAIAPGLTSTATIEYDQPAEWSPADTVCAGFHHQKQEKARLGDDGKTWVSQSSWICSWVPVVIVAR